MAQFEFTPSHAAPPDGLQAWTNPDPAQPSVADVQPGVRMQVLERRGAWAHVLFSNGWRGWVDGRRMLELPARPAPPARAASGPTASGTPAAGTPAAGTPAAGTARPQAGQQPGAEDQPATQARPQLAAQPPPQPRTAAQLKSTPPLKAQAPPQAQPKGQPQPTAPGRQAPVQDQPSPWSPETGPAYHPQDDTAGANLKAPARGAAKAAELEPDDVTEAVYTGPFPVQDRPLTFKVTVAAAGVLLVVAGTLLPWIRMVGFRGNAFRVPLTFLVDYNTGGSSLKVGLLLFALAAAAGVFCVLPGQVRVRRALGAGVILVSLVYILQLQRALSAVRGAPSLTSVLGFGLFIVLAGGVALVVDSKDPSG